MDGDDVGVFQIAGGLSLAIKTRPHLLVEVLRLQHELDGDGPAEHGIAGFINLAHPTEADLPNDLVFANFLHETTSGRAATGGMPLAAGFS